METNIFMIKIYFFKGVKIRPLMDGNLYYLITFPYVLMVKIRPLMDGNNPARFKIFSISFLLKSDH